VRTVAIIQARMGSTRLPGKVMKKLCGKSVLEHVIRRVQTCRLLDDVVVATTTSSEDNVIVAEAERCGAKWFRGSEEDVLDRYYQAAKQFAADVVVRVTSDCPLFDPELLGEMIVSFRIRNSQVKRLDYLSNTIRRTYPLGLDAEVFPRNALEYAHFHSRNQYEREHVTPYIYEHQETFSIHSFEGNKDLSCHRWTLDTEDDFKLIRKIYSELYRENEIFPTNSVIALLGANPEWKEINAHVKQKKLGE
jgi:spore coat polysaccharide biosynthesis protein SpsF